MKTGYSDTDLSLFFDPQSVAVIGSFREGFFGGYVVIKSLLNAGYGGKIYPVNPAYQEVFGLRTYPSLSEVGAPVDLAIIMINARGVPAMLRELAKNRVRAAVVVSDGFAERDRQGARLQSEVLKIAREFGIRIIGPNTAGIADSANGFNPCPYEAGYYRLVPGGMAICSQTGMTNPQAYPYPQLGFGVSKICDFGNKCDVNESDLLEYLGEDPATRVISMYLESIGEGPRFLRIAERVARKKPVCILKSGRTQEGARASASHTGSMAMDDGIFDAACRQAGILRLDKWHDLFQVPKIFAMQPLPKGNRVAIISYTGGIGVLATDECANHGLVVARLSTETAEQLESVFAGLGKIPVDIGPMAPVVNDFFSLYPNILKTVMADPHVDSLFNVIWADPAGAGTEAYRDAYSAVAGDHQKPLVTWIYGPDPSQVAGLATALEDLGFPVFEAPETAIKAIGLAFRFHCNRNRGSSQGSSRPNRQVG
jgi:acetyltransferase